jgi:hypothetical protein
MYVKHRSNLFRHNVTLAACPHKCDVNTITNNRLKYMNILYKYA